MVTTVRFFSSSETKPSPTETATVTIEYRQYSTYRKKKREEKTFPFTLSQPFFCKAINHLIDAVANCDYVRSLFMIIRYKKKYNMNEE